MSKRKAGEHHFEEDDSGNKFYVEYEPIDEFDDILEDGREAFKHRTLLDAIEEYKRMKEERNS